MVGQKVIAPGFDGFHMRSAMVLAESMSAFESTVEVHHNGNVLDAKSLLELMAGCIRYGDEMEIIANGPDEREALEVAVKVVESSRDRCPA